MLTKSKRPIQCLTLAARRDTKTAVRILLCVSLHFSCAADTCQLKGDRSLFITGGGEGGEGGGRGEEIEGFMLIQSKIYLSAISLCCIMKIKKDERVEKKI